jgi:hypothetical protein
MRNKVIVEVELEQRRRDLGGEVDASNLVLPEAYSLHEPYC